MSELIRAITPLTYGAFGAVIAITCILNSPKIKDDRFFAINTLALGAISAGAGAITQNNGKSQIASSKIDNVDIESESR